MSRQPDISVETYVHPMELLRGSGRKGDAAQIARQGLLAAARAYGAYLAGHPFVAERQRDLQ